MSESYEYRVGDEIEITNDGQTYSTYSIMAELMKLKKFHHGASGRDGERGIIISIRQHHAQEHMTLYAVELEGKRLEVIMDKRGFKIIEKVSYLDESLFEL